MKAVFVLSFLSCWLSACTLFGRCSSPEEGMNTEDPNEEFVHVIPGNGDEACSPYFFVKSNDPQKSWMPLKSTRAYAQITGNIANVKVEQIYKNESNRKLDAIYIFPGSTRAAVYGLDMTVGKRTIHAKVKEREQARREFEKARKKGRRATLLEQDRPNVFKMEVSNIGPGETVKVEMYYTELLEYGDKEYEFVYPTAVGPRYSTTNEEYVQRSIEQLMSKHQPKFDVQVVIDGAIPVQSVASPSHSLKMKRLTENSTLVTMQNPQDETLGKDFILRYGLQGGEVLSGLTLYEHNDENFFLFMMQPPKETSERMIMPREYIFIVDVSGSMHGFPLEVSKTILRRLISSLRPSDRFNVLLFESSQTMLSDVSLPATEENIKKALRVIDRQQGGGGTELYPALQKAFSYDDPSSKDYARTFIIATDGFVNVESRVFQLIRDNLNKASFVPLGIGESVNRHLIEGMAWAGASEPFIIENRTRAEEVGDKLIQTISQPLFSQISADWGDFQAYDTYPQTIPDVFSDRPIIVFGKYKGKAQGDVRLQGKTAMGDFTMKIPVAYATRSENPALRYLWARNKIKYLSDYASLFDNGMRYVYNSGRGTDSLRRQTIVDLGLKYNLLTSYTSFLAVDDRQPEYDQNTEIVEEVRFASPLISQDAISPDEDLMVCKEEVILKQAPRTKQKDEFFAVAEVMPSFSGGEQALLEYIERELQYPEAGQKAGIQGRVVLRFIVTATGEITDISVIRSLSPAFDREAIRIVKNMPKWTPGRQNGQAVDVCFTLPIRFQLTH